MTRADEAADPQRQRRRGARRADRRAARGGRRQHAAVVLRPARGRAQRRPAQGRRRADRGRDVPPRDGGQRALDRARPGVPPVVRPGHHHVPDGRPAAVRVRGEEEAARAARLRGARTGAEECAAGRPRQQAMHTRTSAAGALLAGLALAGAADAAPPAVSVDLHHRTLVVTRTADAEAIALRPAGRKLEIDAGRDGRPSSGSSAIASIASWSSGATGRELVVAGGDARDRLSFAAGRDGDIRFVRRRPRPAPARRHRAAGRHARRRRRHRGRRRRDRERVNDVDLDLAAADGAADRVVVEGTAAPTSRRSSADVPDASSAGSPRSSSAQRRAGRRARCGAAGRRRHQRRRGARGRAGHRARGRPGGDDGIDGGDGGDLVIGGGGSRHRRPEPRRRRRPARQRARRAALGPGRRVRRRGRPGRPDSLLFIGSADDETFTATADGRGVRFTRDVGGIVMDLRDVEHLETLADRGADRLSVGDLVRHGRRARRDQPRRRARLAGERRRGRRGRGPRHRGRRRAAADGRRDDRRARGPAGHRAHAPGRRGDGSPGGPGRRGRRRAGLHRAAGRADRGRLRGLSRGEQRVDRRAPAVAVVRRGHAAPPPAPRAVALPIAIPTPASRSIVTSFSASPIAARSDGASPSRAAAARTAPRLVDPRRGDLEVARVRERRRAPRRGAGRAARAARRSPPRSTAMHISLYGGPAPSGSSGVVRRRLVGQHRLLDRPRADRAHAPAVQLEPAGLDPVRTGERQHVGGDVAVERRAVERLDRAVRRPERERAVERDQRARRARARRRPARAPARCGRRRAGRAGRRPGRARTAATFAGERRCCGSSSVPSTSSTMPATGRSWSASVRLWS